MMMDLQETGIKIHIVTQTIHITDKITQIIQRKQIQVLMKIMVTEKVLLKKRTKMVVQLKEKFNLQVIKK